MSVLLTLYRPLSYIVAGTIKFSDKKCDAWCILYARKHDCLSLKLCMHGSVLVSYNQCGMIAMHTFHVSLETVIHIVVILVNHCAWKSQLATVSLQCLLMNSGV